MIQRIKNNEFARNSLVLFTGTMVVNVLNYVFHLALGRMVSVEAYGEIESLLSLTLIISVPSVAIGMVATKFSAGHKAENDPSGNYGVMQFLNKKVTVWGLPVFFALIFATPFVGRFLKITSAFSLILVWIIMFLSFFLAINSGVISGWQKFKEVNWMNIGGAVAKLIFAIMLIKIGLATTGAIGGYVLGMVASFLISLLFLRFILNAKHPKNDIKEIDLRPVKKFIMPALIGSLAINILGNADMVLAKHNLDPLAAGQYGALTIVSKIIFYATGIIATVLFAMSSESNHKKNNSFAILKNAIYLMIFVSAVSVAVYWAFPAFVMGLLFGNKYSGVSHYLVWFAIASVLYSFVNLFFQYLMSIHETKIAYLLLVLSFLSIAAILFLGNNIFVIISAVAMVQLVSIVACLVLLKQARIKNNA